MGAELRRRSSVYPEWLLFLFPSQSPVPAGVASDLLQEPWARERDVGGLLPLLKRGWRRQGLFLKASPCPVATWSLV